ncbi:alanine racemase [Candidatus Cloacimonadota bacterium]
MKLTKPTLIINKEQVIANIEKMAGKARSHNLFFRPHFKTHQSKMIGELFRDAGVTGITVSSVEMAEYFREAGWQNITIAFPCNILEVDKINRIAKECDLKILIVNKEAVHFLQERLTNKVSFLIEIDNGYHRTGIDAYELDRIDEILQVAKGNELLEFKGFLTHSGNSYLAQSKAELKLIHQETLKQMEVLKKHYCDKFPDLITSLGDTPCCSVLDDFGSIDEIRPGNFVFYDLMQEQIGSCEIYEIAIALACPVVAKNADRLDIAIYGGAIHLSKEFILEGAGNKVFGKVVLFDENSWSEPVAETSVVSLSQEHGIIRASKWFFDQVKIGDVLGILPVHSCLTANLMRKYVALDGLNIDHL